jgi:hypothetical protein
MMSTRRQKTDVQFSVEVMPRLRAAINAMPPGDVGEKHLTLSLVKASPSLLPASVMGPQHVSRGETSCAVYVCGTRPLQDSVPKR